MNLTVILFSLAMMGNHFLGQTNAEEKPYLFRLYSKNRCYYCFIQRPPAPVWTYECGEQKKCTKTPYNVKTSSKPIGLLQCRQFCGNTKGIDFWPLATGPLNSTSLTFLEISYRLIRFRTIESPGTPETFWTSNKERFRQKIQAKYLNDPVEENTGGASLLIDIHVLSSDTKLTMDTDETYKLTVGLDQRYEIVARIEANTMFGARHALETLSQLIFYDDGTSQLLVGINLQIEDGPKYGHRGITLDTARNYYSVNAIKRTIDAMAMVKLNVFHWHITDSQSFPVIIKTHPYLSKYGAYSPAKTYTATDVRGIVEYAYVRGVRVIPEFDAPAHVGEGWQFTNLTCFNAQPWKRFCAEPPCGQFNPAKEKLYDILEDIYRELVDMFGNPDLFHMGGDEVSPSCWAASNELRQWMADQGWGNALKDYMRVWGYFQDKALSRLDKTVAGKNKIIMWTSMLTKDPYLTKYLNKERYIIQVWTSGNDPQITHILKQGFKIIISNHDSLYLDCGAASWVGRGQNWCAPYIGWQKIYENRLNYGSKYQSQILGAEAALWSEQADEQSLDGRLWPRGIALAELLWSAPETSYRLAEPRILLQRERFVANGISAEVLQPHWCVQNEGNCPYV